MEQRSHSASEDIDQLDSTSEHYVGQGSTNYAKFEMPKALKRPRDVSYSVRSLYDDMKRGLIDVDPEYQRDVVWKTAQQIMLIDSIFTNHYMPPIIFDVIYDDNGTEIKKICLDGKQRLTSLRLFMDGAIPLKHPDTLKSWWYKIDGSSNPKSKNLLPDGIRTSFANRQIRCTEYEDLDEDDEREIFRRVQLGVALSSAEKLRVLNSPRARFINDLKDLFVTKETLGAPSFRWDRSRGADYRCLAQAVYIICRWDDDNGKSLKNAGTLPQVEKWLNEEASPIPEDFANLIKKTFSVTVQLAVRAEYSQPFEMYPKVSPIEIIGVLLMTYAHFITAPPSQRLTLSELSAAVAIMRRDVRKEHKDIRLNDRVGKTIIGFVKTYHKPMSPRAPTAGASASILPPIVTLDYPSRTSTDTSPSQPPLFCELPPQPVPSSKRTLELPHPEGRAPKRAMFAEPGDAPDTPTLSSASRNLVEVSSSLPGRSGYVQRATASTPTPVRGAPMLSLLSFPVPGPQFIQRHGNYPYVVGPSGYIYPGTSPTRLYSLSYPPPSPHYPPLPLSSSSTASASQPRAAPPETVKTEASETASVGIGLPGKRFVELQRPNRIVGKQDTVSAQSDRQEPSVCSPDAGSRRQS